MRNPIGLLGESTGFRLPLSWAWGRIVLGWTFHRTSIVGFGAAAALAPLVRPRFGRVYSAFAIALLLVLVAILVLAATGDDSDLLAQQLDGERSISSRLNRSTNWNAALHCIRQKPWIGSWPWWLLHLGPYRGRRRNICSQLLSRSPKRTRDRRGRLDSAADDPCSYWPVRGTHFTLHA